MPAITIDRELAEEIVVALDAIAEAERIRSFNADQTPLTSALYAALERLEKATLEPLTDAEREALHDRAQERGGQLVREWFSTLLTEGEVIATR